MNRSEQLVVVLSRNYSTGLSVIRSLGKAGYTVDLVASAASEGASAFIAESKYLRRSVEIVAQKVKVEEDTGLVNALLSYRDTCTNKPVLIAADDYTASVMDRHRDQLRDVFLMPTTAEDREGGITHLMDKAVQSEIARSAGLKVPEDWVIDLHPEDFDIPEDIIYPCFVKPLGSFSGFKQEMARCENREELCAHLGKVRDRFSDRSVLVQEFLDIDIEYDIEGVAADDKAFVPGIIWKRIVAEYDKGVPLAGEIQPLSVLGEKADIIYDLLRRFRYYGMFDLGINVVKGELYFNEINLRSGGTNYVYFKSGVNLSDLFVRTISGKSLPETLPSPKYGNTYLYEKVAWDDYFHGYLDGKELDRCMRDSDVLIMIDEDDPVPGDIFLTEAKRKRRQHLRRKRRNAAVQAMVNATGCDEASARREVLQTKKTLGIGYNDFRKYQLWQYPMETRLEDFQRAKEKKERIKAQREECIVSAMALAGWDRKKAIAEIGDARRRLGITYNAYRKNRFCLIPPEEQQAKFDEIKKKKKTGGERSSEKPVTKAPVPAAHPVKSIEAPVPAAHPVKSAGVPPAPEGSEKPEDTLVVVLSRNYSTGIAVIRSLGAAGYTVDLVASALKEGQSDLARKSKFVRNSVEILSKKVKDGGDTALLDALLSYRGQTTHKPVLFPTDDYTASIVDLNSDLLREIFILPEIIGGGQGSLMHFMNKDVQAALAREAGLLTPREWIFSLEEEIVVPEDMVYPCFCKPVESATGYKKEMRRCDSESELVNHLNTLRRRYYHRSILVQEFLEIDHEIDLSGLCLDQEIIIPGIIRKTNVAAYNKGVTLSGIVVPFEEIGAEVMQKTIEMLKLFRFVGMIDMEFNVVGEKIYFNEVNLRSGGPNFAYFKSGVNLPDVLIKALTGRPFSKEETVIPEFGKSFIYEKVAWDDYIHGFMTRKELEDCLRSSDIKLLQYDEDPVPGQIFMDTVHAKHKKQKKKDSKKARKSFFNRFIAPGLRRVKHLFFRFPQMLPGNERDPKSEKPRVLVTGRNYCSNLCMARSLGEAGYEVEVLRIFQKKPKRTAFLKKLRPAAYSKYVKAFYICVSNRKNRTIVNRLLKIADPERKMLLIPADDLMAYIVDTYYEQLSDFYIMPNIDDMPGKVYELMGKDLQKQMAREAGLPVLNSCLIRSFNGAFEIPETVTYPCFIKPNISKNSSKGRMRVCENYEELFEVLTAYSAKNDIEFLVEDYVRIKNEYSILGVSTRDGAVGPGFFVAEVGGNAEHRGVAVTGRILPCSTMQKLIDDSVRFVGSLGFNGLYDIDLIETEEGKIYFVEVNMRFGASGYAVTKCGVNLPAMFADYMVFGKPIDFNCKVERDNVTFVSEKVLIEEYAQGRLEYGTVRELMNDADIHFIQTDNDPKPYRYFRKYYFYAARLRRKALQKKAEAMRMEAMALEEVGPDATETEAIGS